MTTDLQPATEASLGGSLQNTPAVSRPVSPYRQTTWGIVRSEWIKLRSLRATWTGLAALAVVLIGIGAIAAAVASGSVTVPDGGGGPGQGSTDALSTVLTGSNFAVLILGVLGCLAGAREYASRMITATIAAVPRRWPIVPAKALTLAAAALPVVLVSVFVAFGAGMAILSAGDSATVSLSDSGVLGSLLGMAYYLTAITLIGLALGVLLRSTAASIGSLIAGLLIVPALAGALLPDSWGTILQYLPTNAASAFTAVQATGDHVLSSAGGVVVLGLWVIASLAAATVAMVRRDV